MSIDWRAWHQAYDAPGSPLSRRLTVVQALIRQVLELAPPGGVQVVSMCAGEGRDLLGVLVEHPRRDDVTGRLVELDPELAAQAAAHAPAGVAVVCGDASTTSAYAGAVPADLVLVCGVFGNISDADIDRTLAALPSLCAPRAHVIWTRHRRPPDRTATIRSRLEDLGFDEVHFEGSQDLGFGVGMHRLATAPQPLALGVRLFTFVGYRALA